MWRIVSFFRDWLPGFFRFIRHIPGYWRLETKEQGLDPEAYDFIIRQYETVLMYITKSRMSKPTYYAHDVIRMMEDLYCEGCEYKELCEKQ